MTTLIERLRAIPTGNVVIGGTILQEAADEIERLTREKEALREDAERYRWLRGAFTKEDVDYYYLSSRRNVEDIDQWVDEARKDAE